MIISAANHSNKSLCEEIKLSGEDITVNGCCGERFLCCGEFRNKAVTINGIPGNALGAYLNGCEIIVNGNAQDAVGDTMNDGKIIIHGSAGDALGYAMRGGKIYVKENSGYRTGIHMKAFGDKRPVIIVGGKAGSFLGEYLAGGTIMVLGLYNDGVPLTNFTGAGMHGGEIFVRSARQPEHLPSQVLCERLDIKEHDYAYRELESFSKCFGISLDKILSVPFYHLTPNTQNPYRQLYTEN